jgi:hypothetical protein
MDQDDGVILGEVNRNVSGLRTDLRDLSKDVVKLKVTTGTQADKTRRLESIVYGALATGTAGLITAVMAVATTR